ncbi:MULTISPECIES: alpha/beta fold hydrolase [Corallococcus]|uniref:alpha/beta fold hydrolase n=1 Tax=Corallococcus TaxID=83461 RepID=UPI0011817640|nr:MULTISPECIES: alpha/beta hydrolase [Corallococcus]NBD09390.1 alpha/beta fold hydrolase [Corallococcus silvisoli]TSC31350.1 alpha/beta hydrolase [Corallococcus sp. Z5C101001]
MPFATKSGRRIHYEVQGRGPPLLLLHGLLQLGSHWALKGYLPALTEAYTVVTFDSLGHGRSEAPHDLEAYRLRHRVEDVLSVLDTLSIGRAQAWGYSMGGWTLCGLAAAAPERLTSYVVGGWDPVVGLPIAYAALAKQLKSSEEVDWFHVLLMGARRAPELAEAIDAGDLEALRLCLRACEDSAGQDEALVRSGRPGLLYCGEKDPYHDAMKGVAERAGAAFATIEHADHGGAWAKAPKVLPHVLPFLASTASK